MKVVKIDAPLADQYPCLMEGEYGGVVLFTSYQTGTLISVGGAPPLTTATYVGFHCTLWDQDAFTPYKGTISLSN